MNKIIELREKQAKVWEEARPSWMRDGRGRSFIGGGYRNL